MKTMNRVGITARWELAATLALVGAGAWAADPADHDAHHPEGAASAPKAPAAKASAPKARAAKTPPAKAAASASMGMMDAKMVDRMPEATTP